jgi:ribonuclease HI
MISLWLTQRSGMKTLLNTPSEPLHWRPPQEDFYKVNWDAALNSANRRMGVGIIVRDHLGMVIAARSQTLEFLPEPVVAEAIAALHAAEFSRDLGLPTIVLEGDSLQVVKEVQDMRPTWSRYGHIAADIHTVLQGVRSWQICHTKRATNFAAHGLAKEATLNVIDRVWMEDIPKLYP